MKRNGQVEPAKSTAVGAAQQEEEVSGEKLYDVAEAAKKLGVDDSTIRRHINNDDIVAFKLGKKWRIKQRDLDDFVDRLRQASLDRVRDERLAREMDAKIRRLRSNPLTAQEWSVTTCRQCTKPVLLRWRWSDRSESYRWQGDCTWCRDPHDLAANEAKSLVAAEQERIAFARERVKRLEQSYSADAELARTHASTYCPGRRRAEPAPPRLNEEGDELPCMERVLLRLNEEGDDLRWKGRCYVCGYQHDLPRDACRSLADQARRDRLWQSTMRELEEAAHNAEAAGQIAVLHCVNKLCDEMIIAAHLVRRDGEEFWVGTCRFCNAGYEELPFMARSLADDPDQLMFDIPF